MTIFYVTDVFVRYGGGAPNVIKELAKQQLTAGHKVEVLTFRHSPDWPPEEEIEGIPVRRADLKNSFLPFYITGFLNMRKLAREVFAQQPPDILHLHMPFSGLAALQALKVKSQRLPPHRMVPGTTVPIVYTFHGSWAEESAVEARGLKRQTGLYLLEKLLMRQIEKKALSRADIIVTLSKFMQNEAKKYQVTPRFGREIIPAGVDCSKFKVKSLPRPPIRRAGLAEKVEFRKVINVPDNSFLLLCVRRLAKRMGLEQLIDAIDIVREVIPEVFLIIGGKGELSSSLKLKVGNLKLQENVRLEGFIPEEKYADYCAAADLFVLPTQALEGFGLVILESLACGTPVLGTPVGAIPEVIGPFSKDFILKSTEAKDIADGIISFYQNYFGKDQQIRRQAREYAEGFGWEKMSEMYSKVYEKTLPRI